MKSNLFRFFKNKGKCDTFPQFQQKQVIISDAQQADSVC